MQEIAHVPHVGFCNFIPSIILESRVWKY